MLHMRKATAPCRGGGPALSGWKLLMRCRSSSGRPPESASLSSASRCSTLNPARPRRHFRSQVLRAPGRSTLLPSTSTGKLLATGSCRAHCNASRACSSRSVSATSTTNMTPSGRLCNNSSHSAKHRPCCRLSAQAGWHGSMRSKVKPGSSNWWWSTWCSGLGCCNGQPLLRVSSWQSAVFPALSRPSSRMRHRRWRMPRRHAKLPALAATKAQAPRNARSMRAG
mmetsp:Transcript_98467/g.317468  ORF Transcript_98467/g.317468 Transcript_98467/m.317468 type:complete len:225 (-) Transcript_98467:194-868(-)